MTRGKAIKVLEMFLHKQCDLKRTEFAYDQNTIWEAVNMASESLEQEPLLELLVKDSQTLVKDLVEDAISRQTVLDKIKEVCFSREQEWIDFRVSQGSNGQRDFIIKFIESLPSIQPQLKTGHWIHFASGDDCSECGWSTGKYISPSKYCPNCGAKMEG